MISIRKKSAFAVALHYSRRHQKGRKSKIKCNISLTRRLNRLRRLRSEIGKVKLEQKAVKEGQINVRHKLEVIEADCDELQKECELIIQQSANTQIRLALMFQILKAREDNDFTKAAQLTQVLRELVMERKS